MAKPTEQSPNSSKKKREEDSPAGSSDPNLVRGAENEESRLPVRDKDEIASEQRNADESISTTRPGGMDA